MAGVKLFNLEGRGTHYRINIDNWFALSLFSRLERFSLATDRGHPFY